MIDWKTWAIVALAVWCAMLTVKMPKHRRVGYAPTAPTVEQMNKAMARAERRAIYDRKRKERIQEIKDSRPIWIKWKAGEKVKGNPHYYGGYLDKFMDLKDAPHALQEKLDETEKEDAELARWIVEDLSKRISRPPKVRGSQSAP